MKITEHVSFIGAQNPSMRVFDIIMRTEYGTSYNSYLVQGEETAIVETVHADFTEEYIEKIEEIVPVKQIKYVILNHTEPDHTGSMAKLLEINPDIVVLGSPAAIKNIGSIMNTSFNSRIVKHGETLDLGTGVILKFLIAPNLHWPDSMFTYLEKDKVLFSCDVLGSHYCEPSVWDKHVKNPDQLRQERKNYYDCIFGPFKKFVIAGLDKIKDLEFTIACPSHGPVLQEYLAETLKDYREWSQAEAADKFTAIFYVSAYGYTKEMAETFREALTAKGHKVKVYNIIEEDAGEMAAALNQAELVLFGSPTINRDALKPVWDLISATDAVNAGKKPALCFGSYGWSGEACKYLNERLKALKYNVVSEGVTCIFKPTKEDKEAIQSAAGELSAMLTNEK